MTSERLQIRFKRAIERDDKIAKARNNLVLAERHGVLQWKAVSDTLLRIWRVGQRDKYVDWRPHRDEGRLIISSRYRLRKRVRLLDDVLDLLDLDVVY